MQLRIIHRGSELIALSTEVDTSVLQVKTAIGKEIAVPTQDQTLTHRGVCLEDSRRLKDYGIEESDSVELSLPLSQHKVICVRVVVSPHDVVSIPISRSATVAELRAKIVKRSSGHTADLSTACLVYSHWVLDDWRRLEEYETKEGASITVARALEGGKEAHKQADDVESPKTPAVSTRRMIKVNFIRDSDDPLTLTLDASQALRGIGKSVEERTGIPPEHQTFVLPRRQVDADRTLEDLNIEDGGIVYVGDSRSKELQAQDERASGSEDKMVVYFDLNGSRILLTVRKESTVKEVRRLYQIQNHLFGKRIDFYYKKVLLKPGRLLTDYGIRNESVIEVTVSP